MVKLKINERDLEKVIDKILGHFAFLLQRELIERLPPSFKNRISVSKEGADWIVGSNYKIFQYYVKGTKPHLIKPKVAKALAFKWPKAPTPPSASGLHFFKEVKHPGTKGSKVIDDLERDRGTLRRLLDIAIRNVSI